ncbi:hypothetical protein TNCV_2122551 [Trichonephila clavipes]|nr:hypothetical protein TNCV_2122551 [Trichonephila clavipes]
MDSLARQIQELSLQVAELTRERNSSRHQRYSSDRRRSHSRSSGVSIEEVASATIIAVIKAGPQVCFTLCICAKKRVSSVIAGMAEPSKLYQPVIFIRPQVWPEIPHRLWK